MNDEERVEKWLEENGREFWKKMTGIVFGGGGFMRGWEGLGGWPTD